jgi:hypothetical protein
MSDIGRPVEYTPEKIEEIKQKLLQYIDDAEIPILAEFAYKNNIRRATLYEIEDFSYTIKKCMDKKEAQLEKKALNEDINVSMAIFSLKQLGWKDKTQIETVGDTVIKVDLIDD